jgi:hypothetical protein
VADIGWSILGESDVDTCHWVTNNKRTRGPIQGRHVSLTGWLRSLYIKCWRSRGSTPGPPHSQRPHPTAQPIDHILFLIIYVQMNIFEFINV